MINQGPDSSFIESLQKLINDSTVKIDRPKDSAHPRYSDLIYSLDYGFLEGTSSGDGDGIDIWVGTKGGKELTAVVAVCDLLKKDTELKLLLGCNSDDIQKVLRHHIGGSMSAMIVWEKK